MIGQTGLWANQQIPAPNQSVTAVTLAPSCPGSPITPGTPRGPCGQRLCQHAPKKKKTDAGVSWLNSHPLPGRHHCRGRHPIPESPVGANHKTFLKKGKNEIFLSTVTESFSHKSSQQLSSHFSSTDQWSSLSPLVQQVQRVLAVLSNPEGLKPKKCYINISENVSFVHFQFTLKQHGANIFFVIVFLL